MNIGPAMQKYCREVGVHTPDDLQQRGYLPVYLALRANRPRRMNRMALYALYGALHDIDCTKLPESIKNKLNEEVEEASACGEAGIPSAILP